MRFLGLQSRRVLVRPSKRRFDFRRLTRPMGGAIPKISEVEIERFLGGLRDRAPSDVVRAFHMSIDFAKGSPVEVVLESRRQGAHRKLELEEAYNREAFRWASANKAHALFRMPWATNLTPEENFQLREFAISALIRSGRIQ